MTDIIERLRQTSRDFGFVAAVTALEAADEIERLRGMLRTCEGWLRDAGMIEEAEQIEALTEQT